MTLPSLATSSRLYGGACVLSLNPPFSHNSVITPETEFFFFIENSCVGQSNGKVPA